MDISREDGKRRVIVVGAPMEMADYAALLEVARDHGWVFARSNRPNEAAAARHLVKLGLQVERGTGTVLAGTPDADDGSH